MRKNAAVIVPSLLLAIAPCVSGQSVSTATVRGVVLDERGGLLGGAQVQLINRATGHRVAVDARGAHFSVAGLEVGGPYSIIVRRLGYDLYSRDSLFLALGESLEISVVLTPFVKGLDKISVLAGQGKVSSGARMGVGARIGEGALHQLPTLNRDLYDFVQLTPEVSVRSGLISGGGTSPRYNNFLIDGVSQRHLQGSLPTGGFNGGKSLSMEAVREYEVILSAFDVRYGDFAGAIINAITKRGTNRPFASAFLYGRNERLAQDSPFLRASPYERLQYGVTFGGPLVRDRVHVFVAPEFQRLTAPANGPYLGQEKIGRIPAPVTAANVERFTSLLAGYGIDAGTAARVNVASPLANVFGRIDFFVPALSSRAVLWHNYSHLNADRFDRSTPAAFPLSSVAWTQEIVTHASALQVFTSTRRGALNELVMAYTDNPQRAVPRVQHPLILVTVPGSGPSGGFVALQAGTREIAQGGGEQGQSSLEVTDHFSFSGGTGHRIAFGGRAEFFALRAPGVVGSYGRWEFSSLDSLRDGDARVYTETKGSGGAALLGVQYGAYAGDEWRPNDRIEFAFGVRADAMVLQSRPPYNASIDAIYQRRTDAMPRSRVHLSPRAGFRWDAPGGAPGRLRGRAGVFSVRPPLAWLHAAMYNDGQSSTLVCGPRLSDAGPVPPFEPDYRLAPQQCADGAGFAEGPVHLLDRNLTLLAQHFRASLAYDRALPWGFSGTVEGLYSRSLTDFLFVNLKLAGPQSVDRFGRVLYGSIDPSGFASPATVAGRPADIVDIDLRKQSRNHAYQLAARLERFGNRLTLAGSYALSHVRDVQSLGAAFPPTNNWRDGRALSGRHESVTAGVSVFEVQHRIVLSATARAPWRRRTEFSLYYIGESGSPFTYVATGAQGRGDLNADGTNANDPIYVPKTAVDTAEIRFSGQSLAVGADNSPAALAERVMAQQDAFERFIVSSACLRGQRGRIVQRNSCRGAWVNTTNASVRQSLLVRREHAFAIQLEVFNLLNLLNDGWGQYRQPSAAVLQHVAQLPSVAAQTQPVFQFDTAMKKYSTENVESGYQLQLALRYSF